MFLEPYFEFGGQGWAGLPWAGLLGLGGAGAGAGALALAGAGAGAGAGLGLELGCGAGLGWARSSGFETEIGLLENGEIVSRSGFETEIGLLANGEIVSRPEKKGFQMANSNKQSRIAVSLKRYFQMQLGTGTRARVLEAVAARLRFYRRQLVTGHQLGLRMVGCSVATTPSAESGFHRDDTSSVLMPQH